MFFKRVIKFPFLFFLLFFHFFYAVYLQLVKMLRKTVMFPGG